MEKSSAWIRNADGQFFLHDINDELVKYYNTLNAIPESVVNKIADFVKVELPADQYTKLQHCLVNENHLSPY